MSDTYSTLFSYLAAASWLPSFVVAFGAYGLIRRIKAGELVDEIQYIRPKVVELVRGPLQAHIVIIGMALGVLALGGHDTTVSALAVKSLLFTSMFIGLILMMATRDDQVSKPNPNVTAGLDAVKSKLKALRAKRA